MAGTLNERSPGVWQLRLSLKNDHGQTIRPSRTVHTARKREAERALREFAIEMEAEIAERTRRASGDATVAEVIASYCEIPRSRRTMDNYRKLARKLRIGGLNAEALTVAATEAELRRIAQAHGTATAAAVFRLLRAAMNEAERLDLIERSIMRKVRAPKHKQAAKVAISGEQIIRIIARIEREGRRDLAVLFRLAAMSGARRGELAALRWDDIDFSRGQITISRALSAGEEKDTKTGVIKTISLDARTMEALRGWHDECAFAAIALGLAGSAHVFQRGVDDPLPMHPDTMSHAWARARRGIADGVRFHDLRHFAASAMLAAGVDVATAAERQGHSPRVMMEIYAHALPERDRMAAEVLARTLE